MKVFNQAITKQPADSSHPLREGAVYRATILAREGNNQATLGFQHKKIRATFQGLMPAHNNIAFQIVEKNQEQVVVRPLHHQSDKSQPQQKANSVSLTLDHFGADQPSRTLKKGVAALLDHGRAVTKTAVSSMETFLNTANGTKEQKLQTLQAAATKNIDITENNLKHIHESLHSKSAVRFMNNSAAASVRDSSWLLSDEQVNEAVKRGINGALQRVEEVASRLQRELQTAKNPQNVLENMKTELRHHPQLTPAQRAETESRLQRAESLLQSGKTNEAKQVLDDVLKSVETGARQASHYQAIQDAHSTVLEQVKQTRSVQEAVERVEQELKSQHITKEQEASLRQLLREVQALANAGGKQREQAAHLLQKLTGGRELSQQAIHDLLQKMTKQTRGQLLSQAGISQEGRDKITELLRQSEKYAAAARKHLEQSLAQNAFLQEEQPKSANLSTMVNAFKHQVQKEPNVFHILEQVRQDAVPALFKEDSTQAAAKLDTAEALAKQGKELSARQHIFSLLDEVTNGLEASKQNSAESAYQVNEAMPISSKQLLETRITEKLAAVTEQFKSMKQDVLKQIDQVVKLVQQDKQSTPTAKQIVEAAIKHLDRAILRSDVTLFTDMKTERQLLQTSSYLKEAKHLLDKGQINESVKVVKNVQESLQKMTFAPAEQKVKHFVTSDILSSERPAKWLQMPVAEQSRAVMQDPSARQVFELVRSLGLNRESEIGQMLASSSKDSSSQQHTPQQNLKEVLLQLMKKEDGALKGLSSVNQALSNLTGQQLLSKTDNGSLQHLLFNLPVPVKDDMEQLQVYVQSRQEGSQLDWENCSLYFFIETPVLGETGIMVQAADRQLSVTVKNDSDGFAEAMSPLVDKTTEALSGLGYNISNISYQPLHDSNETEEKLPTEPDAVSAPLYSEKGFDFKV
ncbi:hypothetical protein SAMN05192534_1426 [Alteribacillus persepolensis]|uniref:Hook-length control protein FliK n=1 Tax=Alteribacillus persepolensis TaxID=568899 RepID=A0A1G8K640_9BACI|nr:hypothetical protein [Alteribacillus persepolensis]SDI38904.1 hypothetical protein SAMN05192534_1426 [Alteribacillus persepolensis]